MGGLRFHRLVMIGDLVEMEARLAYTGKTSMNLSVEVRSGDVKTIPVPAWLPETLGDIALAQRVKAHLNAARGAHLGQ